MPAAQAAGGLLIPTTIAAFLLLSHHSMLTVLPFIWGHEANLWFAISLVIPLFSVLVMTLQAFPFFPKIAHSWVWSGWQLVSSTYWVMSSSPPTVNSPPGLLCAAGQEDSPARGRGTSETGPLDGEWGRTYSLACGFSLGQQRVLQRECSAACGCWGWYASVPVPSRWSASLRGEYRQLFIHFFWSVLIWEANLIKCICSSPGSHKHLFNRLPYGGGPSPAQLPPALPDSHALSAMGGGDTCPSGLGRNILRGAWHWSEDALGAGTPKASRHQVTCRTAV